VSPSGSRAGCSPVTHQVYMVCSCRHALLDDPTGKSRVGSNLVTLEATDLVKLLCLGCATVSFRLYYLIFFVLPTSFMWITKTHSRISLQVWLANVLYFCSFCKPTFSGATREWDALYKESVNQMQM
jgi:hypothetical protein